MAREESYRANHHMIRHCSDGGLQNSLIETNNHRGGEVIGLNPRIRIYRYTKGQYFDCHCESDEQGSCIRKVLTSLDDESNLLTLNTKPSPTPSKTTWTLLLYLTSPVTGCEGGQTVFYPDDIPGKSSVVQEPIVVDLEVGTVLLHKHGNDCMLVCVHLI